VFVKTIRPLLRDYCSSSYSTEQQKGELDLERFTSVASIKMQTEVWEHVIDRLAAGEMPPKSAKQMSAEQQRQVTGWIRETLNKVVLAIAPNPRPAPRVQIVPGGTAGRPALDSLVVEKRPHPRPGAERRLNP
jgi:hypothetical protein